MHQVLSEEIEDGQLYQELKVVDQRGEKQVVKTEYLKKKHKDGNILLVTHGDFGKMLYCAYYNLDWKEVLKMFHFGNSDLLFMSPKSKAEDVYVFRSQQYNL